MSLTLLGNKSFSEGFCVFEAHVPTQEGITADGGV